MHKSNITPWWQQLPFLCKLFVETVFLPAKLIIMMSDLILSAAVIGSAFFAYGIYSGLIPDTVIISIANTIGGKILSLLQNADIIKFRQ